MKKYETFFKLNRNDRVLLFNSFSKYERYAVWAYHLRKMLREKKWNDQQKGLIKLSLNHLSPRMYDIKFYEEGQQKQKTFKEKWWPRFEANFTREEIREVFYGMRAEHF